MKGLRRSFWITILVCFVVGGGICAWIADDNNLLQGASTAKEIKKLLEERRLFMIESFFVGGTITALLGAGAVSLIQVITNRRDAS